MAETDTPIIAPDEPTRPPLWKQLVGALGGAAIALVLYSSYEAASPALTAWLSIPDKTPRSDPGEVTFQTKVSVETQNRIAQRAREIAEEFTQRPEHPLEEGEISPTAKTSFHSVVEPMAAITPIPVPEPPAEAPEAVKEELAVPTPEPVVEAKPLAVKTVAQATVPAPKAPALPSSGVGVWLLGFLSALGAIGWRIRERLHEEIISL